MKTRFVRRTTLLVAAVAAAVLSAVSAAVAATSPPSAGVVGHLYVNDNTAGVNTIAGFDRHADGTLTPIPGSPFPAGGAGTGVSTGSQGALELSSDGRYVLAVDAGSNDVSVLRIRHDGRLTLVRHGVVASGGVEPVSIAVHGRLVYVANAGAGGADYTGFTLGHGGRLRPLSGSTVQLPDDSQPGDVLFNSTGTNLLGVRVNTSLIDSFSVGADGRLTTAPGSPFAAQGPGPFGSEFNPVDPTQVFVSNAHGGPGNGTISAFAVARDGTLASIGASPFADRQTAPCWIEISHDGRFLFTVNTGSNTISRYAIAGDGSLVLRGSTPLGDGIATAFDARLAPDGRTLWVVGSASANVGGFAVVRGALRELASSPTALPAGATAFGIVVD